MTASRRRSRSSCRCSGRAGPTSTAATTWPATWSSFREGPRPRAIPIVLAGHGPKGYRHAARLADVWSCYAEEASSVTELGPRVAAFEEACAEVGRDPGSVGRSAGVVVAPLEPAGASGMFGTMIGGSAEQIADALRTFRAAGFTQLELLLHPQTAGSLEAMAPVLELLDAD